MKHLLTLISLLSLVACQSIPKGEIADIIYANGKIITMEDEGAEATSVAIKDGKILAVGEHLLEQHRGDSTTVIDLDGKTMLPGFIDAHSHITMGMSIIGFANLSSPPVGRVNNINDIINELKDNQQKNNIQEGGWIGGWGYDPDLLNEKRHPTKMDLDAAFPANPVVLLHTSGHMGVANSKALAQLGINANTPDPPGGTIVRLPNSKEPNGLLQETAIYAVRQQFSNLPPQQTMKAFEKIQDLYASHGITTAQDGFCDYKKFLFLKQAHKAGKVKLDIEVLAGFLDLEDYFENHFDDFGKSAKVRLTGVKIVADGSPQGKTAFFSKPYLTNVPGCTHECRGYANLTEEQIIGIMKQCYEAGIQVYTHANGDGAIDLFLEAHKEALDGMDHMPDDMRNVIIHSQFVRRDQLESYKQYEMIPAYFTNHAFFWGDVHFENLGADRANFLSPMKTSMDMGLICTNHTDYPVTPIDQLFLMGTAVNRTSRSGKVIGEAQKITPYQALKAITINAAYQHKQEDIKGSIKVGKLADFVILNENPLSVGTEKIKDIEVLETIKEGVSIYSR